MTIQEKAIEQLKRISNHLSSIGEKEDYTDIAIQALEQEPKTEWIPVEDRLPEEEGEYLLWGKVYASEKKEYSFIGEYNSEYELFGYCQEQFDRITLSCLGSDFFEYGKVEAWMPLPPLYKAKEVKE